MLYVTAHLITMQVNAQNTLSAFVYDYTEKKAIPYASIGITGKDVGIITDHDGKYMLFLPMTIRQTDTVIISSVGYQSKMLLIREAQRGDTIFLTRKISELGNITIRPYLRSASYGKISRKKHLNSGWSGEGKGGEIGKIFNIKQPHFKIEKLRFGILNGYDTAWFRLHIRGFANGQPGEELLNEQVILKVTTQTGISEHDLSDYHLVLDSHDIIYISLELLKRSNRISDPKVGNNVLITGNTPGHLYYRWYPQSAWLHKNSYELSLVLTIKY